ncbi:MAG TPA: deoxyribodipyrimidine photolyase, partial [Myxococcota bacterium]|nr:deoxyribodipyrimidine photolyase [Myxococcota bacterium]
GHVGAHEAFTAVAEAEAWDPSHLSPRSHGGKEGWWGMGASAEAFLDQLVTWRELGFNMCSQEPRYDRYASLPGWARDTLAQHTADPRDKLYGLATLEAGDTQDPVWNAAQRQLVREGRLHNYLRMVWGKRVLEWTRDPEEALAVLIELNNKYALDGRDPNSYSGIFWTFGRYDRPWPERPIFGKIRYMSSANTVRKLRMKRYLQTFADVPV